MFYHVKVACYQRSHMLTRGTVNLIHITSAAISARDKKNILFILIQNKLNSYKIQKFQKNPLKLLNLYILKYSSKLIQICFISSEIKLSIILKSQI